MRGERGTLRLTLRRWSAGRFDLTAKDLAGRSLWRLEVDGDRGRLEGYERAASCRFDPTLPLDLPRLELPLAAEILPDLLLGWLPPPNGVAEEDGERYRDARGRLWQVERRGGDVVAWRLVLAPGAADLAWRRDDRGFRLESADGQIVVRWRESARAALAVKPPALEFDPLLPECRELDLS